MLLLLLPAPPAAQALRHVGQLLEECARATVNLPVAPVEPPGAPATVPGPRRGAVISVTFSAGVATCPERGATGDELLVAADRALYEAKAAGRDRVVAAR